MQVFQVDTFTETRFTGNPATVVLGADGHADAMLAAIAREFSQAEVAFVLPPAGADHDLRVRFFNARKEAPFVGHATLAAHAVLRRVGRRGPGVCRQLSGTGVIDVRVSEPDGRIEFRQSVPLLDEPLPLKTTLRVAEALHLSGAQLHEGLPARIARKGSTRLLVPLGHPASLDDIQPNFATLLSLGAELGTEGFFVFAMDLGAARPSTDSRMFCPAIGIPEDPVSGNAHAMLAAYLWDADRRLFIADGFTGRQGRQVQRPGYVEVTLEIEHDQLRAVSIGGKAVIVSDGLLV